MKKLLLSLTSLGVIAAPITALVSCNLLDNDKNGVFWNYEDYMDPDQIDEIKETFKYKEFGDLPELKTALMSGTASAGVGSDYYISMLAGQGLIKKIKFNEVFPTFSKEKSSWEQSLKTLYTDQVWELLNQFKIYKRNDSGKILVDKNGNKIIADNDNDGVGDKLWEYLLPYFMQSRITLFNTGRLLESLHKSGKVDDSTYQILKGHDQDKIQALFNNDKGERPTYKEIYTKLKSWGYKTLNINDYVRENLMIGAEYVQNLEGLPGDVKNISDGKLKADKFLDLVWGSFGKSNTHFETNGTTALESVMDPDISGKNATSDVALLYNGDGADAIDGTETYLQDTIRAVRSKNSNILLDGIVVSSKLNNKKETNVYKMLKENIYKGYNLSATDPSFEDPEANKLYMNFDYEGYVSPFRTLYNYSVMDDPSDEGVVKIQKWILKSTEAIKVSQNVLVQPISNSLTTQVYEYYQSKKEK